MAPGSSGTRTAFCGSSGSRRTFFSSRAVSNGTRRAFCGFEADTKHFSSILKLRSKLEAVLSSCCGSKARPSSHFEQLVRASRATVGPEQQFRALLQGRARLEGLVSSVPARPSGLERPISRAFSFFRRFLDFVEFQRARRQSSEASSKSNPRSPKIKLSRRLLSIMREAINNQ